MSGISDKNVLTWHKFCQASPELARTLSFLSKENPYDSSPIQKVLMKLKLEYQDTLVKRFI
jgi:hypothetical protein